VPDQAIISHGNFHPMVLAIACDALRIALAHVGQLERAPNGSPVDRVHAADDRPADGALYGLQLRYPAAALFPELKPLAAAATLDTPPLDLGVEDHHTAAPLSVRKTDTAVSLLEDLLAIELLLARDMLATAPTTHVLGGGTDATHRMVEEAVSVAGPAARRGPSGLARPLPGQAGGWVRSQRAKCGTVKASVPRSDEYTSPFLSRASRAGESEEGLRPRTSATSVVETAESGANSVVRPAMARR
jgi:histidine ammonia-lyase